MKFLFFFVMLFVCNQATPQNYFVGVSLLQGVNKTFIGGSTGPGHSSGFGLVSTFKNKNGHVFFEPHLFVSKNSYYQKIRENVKIRVQRWGLCVMPMAGIMLNKNVAFKTGLFIITGAATNVGVITEKNGGYYGFGNSELYRDFDPPPLQAGAVLGVSFALGEKKQVWLNFIYQQFATSIVNHDFTVQLTSTTPELVFEGTCKPSVLMAGFNFYFRKKKKEESEE